MTATSVIMKQVPSAFASSFKELLNVDSCAQFFAPHSEQKSSLPASENLPQLLQSIMY
jgi:hypothetical protein